MQGQNYIILGDTTKSVKDAINYVALRFKPRVTYNDFKVDTLKFTSKAPIQYSSNRLARQFKTVITETYQQEGLNFGGHYCFVKWGCGSPCQMSAVVDLRTGIVYDGVDASVGYEFKKDSRLLIVNPPDSSGFYFDCAYCEPIVYVWNEEKKSFEQN